MIGNVFEWCGDAYDKATYGKRATSLAVDPQVAGEPASLRVCRGGGWDSDPTDCRSAYRYWYSPDDRGSILGFRVARRSVRQ